MTEEICAHEDTFGTQWPDGGYVQICNYCGLSRYSWEQGESQWVCVDDIYGVKKEVQKNWEKL